MRLSLIVAASDNGVIGRDGDLPWHLSPDLRRFKRLTMGHHLLMGRKTFESIGRPLPGRTSVVVSRQPAYAAPEGVVRAGSLEEAVSVVEAAGEEEAFVIGGGDVFRQALPLAHRLYLTRVHGRVEGDTTFPGPDPREWREVEREEHPAEGDCPYPFSFLVYERR